MFIERMVFLKVIYLDNEILYNTEKLIVEIKLFEF